MFFARSDVNIMVCPLSIEQYVPASRPNEQVMNPQRIRKQAFHGNPGTNFDVEVMTMP